MEHLALSVDLAWPRTPMGQSVTYRVADATIWMGVNGVRGTVDIVSVDCPARYDLRARQGVQAARLSDTQAVLNETSFFSTGIHNTSTIDLSSIIISPSSN